MNLAGNLQQDAYSRAYDRAKFTFVDGFTNILTLANGAMNTGENIYKFSSMFA
jgi:hypothetical protein